LRQSVGEDVLPGTNYRATFFFGSGSFSASAQSQFDWVVTVRPYQLVRIACYFMFRKSSFCRFRHCLSGGPHWIPPFKSLAERCDVAVQGGYARAWLVLGAGYDKLLKIARPDPTRPTITILTQIQQPAKYFHLHRQRLIIFVRQSTRQKQGGFGFLDST
jgi:hypothetical protein